MSSRLVEPIRRLVRTLADQEIHTEEVNTALSAASQRLLRMSALDAATLLKELGSDPQGLSEEEVQERIERHGRNQVAHERMPAWYQQLVKAFINPFVGILIVLAVSAYLTEVVFAPPGEQDITSVVIITVLILISVLLTFIQEYQSSRAAEQLLTLVQTTATVQRRDRGRVQVATTEIVPGDIVLLAAGDVIPADVYLLTTNNLSVDEAALTGESLPVEKQASARPDPDAAAEQGLSSTASALDLENVGFMGTYVASGTAQVLVVATGSDTYIGSMSQELVGHHPPTSFDRGVSQVSILLIRFMLVMVPIVFLINGLTTGDWFQALLFGLAVAVGLTPEMLPTIVTANLAKGTVEMARRNTIVKRLSAIQNLGAMDVLCTDKTGTLTHDSVGLEIYLNVQGETDLDVLRYTYLNSYHQTGVANPMDEAVLAHEDVEQLAGLEQKHRRVAEIPFESARRRMSVIVEGEDGDHLLITKGAAAELLSISNWVSRDGVVVPLSQELREQLADRADRLGSEGLRVLVTAYRHAEDGQENYRPEDEHDLIVVGFVGFLDPPKESAGPAIEALYRQQVRVRVITGDNEVVTRRICAQIGLPVEGLLHGHQIDAMSDQALQAAVEENNIFVRTAPLTKSRIVNALKQNGATVGFLGDGINDAPALRDADVGISVDNAVDIAKESAGIILLEKDLMVLQEGIQRGRHVFGNIMKYIKITISSNFGNVFSVLVASLVLPFPPMLPLHLLIQNLLYDISQLSIPWDHVDAEYLREPRKWNPPSIARFMAYLGPASSIFDFTTFALMWYLFGAQSPDQQALFHSGWFILGLLSQTLIFHIIRTSRVPFVQSIASKPVLIMTAIVMIIGLILPFTGYGATIGFQAPPPSYFPWLVLNLVAYCVLIQFLKVWYIRRFGTWL